MMFTRFRRWLGLPQLHFTVFDTHVKAVWLNGTEVTRYCYGCVSLFGWGWCCLWVRNPNGNIAFFGEIGDDSYPVPYTAFGRVRVEFSALPIDIRLRADTSPFLSTILKVQDILGKAQGHRR